MAAQIEVENVAKRYTEGPLVVDAVRGVSLSVEPGELVLLGGPSGSGKTTLLSMMGCILRPTSGIVKLMGRPITHWDESSLPLLRRRHVGFIFQHFNLFSALTAAENVVVALELKGMRGPQALTEARALLESVGLGPRWNFLPRDLSGGEKQRVSIARALAGDPPVILADEPTGNLDSKTGHQAMELIRDLTRRERKSTVIVTHDPRITDLADRVYHMEDGRLAA